MCTVILFHQVFSDAPTVLLANRDEWKARPSSAPSIQTQRPGAPRVFCPNDAKEGGTWIGVNDKGIVIALTNYSVRPPNPKTRSRGLLCLDWLHKGSIGAVLKAARLLDQTSYNPFQVLVSNGHEAALVRYTGQVSIHQLDKGVYGISNWAAGHDGDDKGDVYREMLEAIVRERGERRVRYADYEQTLSRMASHHRGGRDPRKSLCCHAPGYGTVSSTIIAMDHHGMPLAYRYAPGPPCERPFEQQRIPWCSPPEPTH